MANRALLLNARVNYIAIGFRRMQYQSISTSYLVSSNVIYTFLALVN